MSEGSVVVEDIEYRYGHRVAIDHVTLHVQSGEIFSILGPNGSGKTTLFRLLSTLIPLQAGNARICGLDLRSQLHEIRQRIGVVFQAPSLDKKLTVRENLRLQAAMYGLVGPSFKARESEIVERFGLTDRIDERTEQLSGGLRRRCELAKCLAHSPQLLLLDEPSTGLDPGARLEFWKYIREIRDASGTTIVLTTHLLDEAEKSDRIAIMDQGRLVALDSPNALRGSIGGICLTVECRAPEELAQTIRDRYHVETTIVEQSLRIKVEHGQRWVNELLDVFPDEIRAVTLSKPSLEDVFIAKTGHRLDTGVG